MKKYGLKPYFFIPPQLEDMTYPYVKKISLTMPPELLVQIDALAERDYTTRSDVMRQALLLYIRSQEIPPRSAPAVDAPAAEDDDFAEVLAKHPHVNPADTELLKFLRDQSEV